MATIRDLCNTLNQKFSPLRTWLEKVEVELDNSALNVSGQDLIDMYKLGYHPKRVAKK